MFSKATAWRPAAGADGRRTRSASPGCARCAGCAPTPNSAVYVFTTERGGPLTDSGVRKIVARAGTAALLPFPVHLHMLRHATGYKLANDGLDTWAIQHYLGHKRPQEHRPHDALHEPGARSVQDVLAGLRAVQPATRWSVRASRAPQFGSMVFHLHRSTPNRLLAGGGQEMNRDVFAGWWKQARGQAKAWWGQLTDDELDQIEGESEKLVGALQTRYGWTREQAEKEIERRMDRAA